MTQETFAKLGVAFSVLVVTGLLAIGIGVLVVSLKEWLQEKRWSTKSMLETQRALMEANDKLNERLTAIADELNAEVGGTCENVSCPPSGFLCSECGWGDFAEPSHLLTTAKFTGRDKGPNFCPNCGKAVKR